MGNVSLPIAALCHAKNLPELETWFRDIIILEWERGKLDKYVGILRIVKNALILINGNKTIFQMSVELYTSWELLHTAELHTSGELRTIQVLSRRVGIYY